MSAHDADFEAWVDRAKAADIHEVAQRLGAKLKRSGREWTGPCPGCGGDDRFSINPKKGVFNCRGSKGGSVIDMVVHVNGGDFLAACETINGDPPPRGEARPIDLDAQRERERERRARDEQRAVEEAKERRAKRSMAERWWDSAGPITGTHAEAYLRARGIELTPSLAASLGYKPDAPLYSGDLDEDGKPILLGKYPCMIAPLRDLDGNVIGALRTYLDRDEPRKLVLPGGQTQAKKLVGVAGGGAIWLGPVLNVMAIAEGIETALSWLALDYCAGVGVCAAYSLGNMAGAATGTRRHPTQNRTIPNGVPDPARPGIRLPPEVREVILLGDGDSDRATTYAHLLTAGARFEAEGRRVLIHMAPEGKDWNDVLREQIAAQQQGSAAA
jgi:hypothetical protein